MISDTTWCRCNYFQVQVELKLPIVDGALRCGYKTIEFDIEKVYKHLVDQGWVEGDESGVGEVMRFSVLSLQL